MSEGPGGASLRYGNPWAGPPQARDPLRRWRGHLVLPITIWLAGGAAGEAPVGLTVSSLVVGQGEPPVLAGVISLSTDLADAVSVASAEFVVHLVGAGQRRLAQHFAGELPAPPELLATTLSPHGPVLETGSSAALPRASLLAGPYSSRPRSLRWRWASQARRSPGTTVHFTKWGVSTTTRKRPVRARS